MAESIPEIAIIAAMDEKRGIGKDGKLPWPRIPADMKRFRDLTMRHAVIMGRRTWDSLDPKYRPLPGRYNIVMTRDLGFRYSNGDLKPEPGGIDWVMGASSLEHALNMAEDVSRTVFVIGGGQIYQETLPLADILYLTRIEGDFNADTFFPEYSTLFSKPPVCEQENEQDGLRYKFVTLER